MVADKSRTLKCESRAACPINATSRKLCAACRYAKCLAIGMSKERFAGNNLDAFSHIGTTKLMWHSNVEEIRSVAALFDSTYQTGAAVLRAELVTLRRLPAKIRTAVINQTLLDCNYAFFSSLRYVAALTDDAIKSLMTDPLLDAFNIASSLLFDRSHTCWDLNSDRVMLNLQLDVRMSCADHRDFFGAAVTEQRLTAMRSLTNTSHADRVAMLLLLLVCLFSIVEDGSSARFSAAVATTHRHLTRLLQLYLLQKYGALRREPAYGQLMAQTRSLRLLSQSMHRCRWQLTGGERSQANEFMAHIRRRQAVWSSQPLDLSVRRVRTERILSAFQAF